jgi:hypothetical protein
MNSSPLVYCIVLSWNGRELTLDCVRSLLRQEYPRWVLVMVDNHSDDGSAAAVREGFGNAIDEGRLVLIENDRNLGFAGGNNIGLRFAFDRGADYVLLLNNDTVVDKDLLRALVQSGEAHPDAGILGPKIFYFDPPDRLWFAGGRIALYRGTSWHIGIREKDLGQYDRESECDYITGCAMMIKRDVLDSVGYLDTAYTLYCEDSDYCLRARQRGYRMLYVPSGRVWHKISAATGGQVNRRKILLRLQNSLRLYRRHARWYHWLTIPIFMLLDSLRVGVLVLARRIRNH